MVARAFILYGLVLIALCLLWPALRRFGVSGLPGDFTAEIGVLQLTVPITSAALVSVVAGAIFWFTNR